MRKTQIVDFLEQKKLKAVKVVSDQALKLIEDRKREIYSDLELYKKAERIQYHASQALDILDGLMVDFKSKGHDFYTGGIYNHLYDMCHKEDATLDLIRCRMILEDKAVSKYTNQRLHNIEHVKREYEKVIESVKAMPTAKKALEYIKELGFDTTELEKKDEAPVTALVAKVDMSALIIK